MAKDYNMDLDRNDALVEAIDMEKPVSSKKLKVSSEPINRDMMIADIVEKHPELVPMIMDLGVHCIGCGAAMFETLGEGFAGHGIPDDEIDTMVEELNKYIEENSSNPPTKHL